MDNIKLNVKLSAYAKGTIPIKVSDLDNDLDFIPDAPNDGNSYLRKDKDWVNSKDVITDQIIEVDEGSGLDLTKVRDETYKLSIKQKVINNISQVTQEDTIYYNTAEADAYSFLTINDGRNLIIDKEYKVGDQIQLTPPTKGFTPFKGWNVLSGNATIEDNVLTVGDQSSVVEPEFESSIKISIDTTNYQSSFIRASFTDRDLTINELMGVEIPTSGTIIFYSEEPQWNIFNNNELQDSEYTLVKVGEEEDPNFKVYYGLKLIYNQETDLNISFEYRSNMDTYIPTSIIKAYKNMWGNVNGLMFNYPLKDGTAYNTAYFNGWTENNLNFNKAVVRNDSLYGYKCFANIKLSEVFNISKSYELKIRIGDNILTSISNSVEEKKIIFNDIKQNNITIDNMQVTLDSNLYPQVMYFVNKKDGDWGDYNYDPKVLGVISFGLTNSLPYTYDYSLKLVPSDKVNFILSKADDFNKNVTFLYNNKEYTEDDFNQITFTESDTFSYKMFDDNWYYENSDTPWCSGTFTSSQDTEFESENYGWINVNWENAQYIQFKLRTSDSTNSKLGRHKSKLTYTFEDNLYDDIVFEGVAGTESSFNYTNYKKGIVYPKFKLLSGDATFNRWGTSCWFGSQDSVVKCNYEGTLLKVKLSNELKKISNEEDFYIWGDYKKNPINEPLFVANNLSWSIQTGDSELTPYLYFENESDDYVTINGYETRVQIQFKSYPKEYEYTLRARSELCEPKTVTLKDQDDSIIKTYNWYVGSKYSSAFNKGFIAPKITVESGDITLTQFDTWSGSNFSITVNNEDSILKATYPTQYIEGKFNITEEVLNLLNNKNIECYSKAADGQNQFKIMTILNNDNTYFPVTAATGQNNEIRMMLGTTILNQIEVSSEDSNVSITVSGGWLYIRYPNNVTTLNINMTMKQ